MNKRFLFITIGVLGLGAILLWVVPSGSDWLEERRIGKAVTDDEISRKMTEFRGTGGMAQAPVERLDMKRTVRLAIGGLGLASEDQNRLVSDLALTQLGDVPGIQTVERQALDAILRELNLNLSGLVRAKDVVRVGKLVRADWFLLGSPVSLSGTNFTVLRVVDARTGVIRDAGVFAAGQTLAVLASDVESFIRKSRQNAAEAKSPVYLAVGSFEDLSLNNRQAAFPMQLRSYLTAAYQKESITLLEREFANTLLQEIRLDMAGMTEGAETNGQPMQAAYWMVDGSYQSYETAGFEVELKLNVRRMFGRNKQLEFRDKPEEKLFQKVKDSIDGVMKSDKSSLTPTRQTEARAQIEIGEEIIKSVKLSLRGHFEWLPYYENVSETEVARIQRNLGEAIRAFETALILDPNNRRARMGVATCYKSTFIFRVDEAREIYREIIEESTKDGWGKTAMFDLAFGFKGGYNYYSAEVRRKWFESALHRTQNPTAAEFYRAHVEAAREDGAMEEGGDQGAKIAEDRLLKSIPAWENEWRGNSRIISFHGIESFAESFGTNLDGAAKRLAELLPKLQKESPALSPYILAGVAKYQVDTNSPVITQFEKDMEENAMHPEKLFHAEFYFSLLTSRMSHWAAELKLFRLAAKTIECRDRASRQGKAAPVDNDLKMGLAFYYMNANQWKDALPLFESYSNRPVRMNRSGVWGNAFVSVLTSKHAARCRQELGLTPIIDSREFEMSKELICLHEPSVFSLDHDGVWIGISGQLLHLNFNLQTNATVALPIGGYTPINCISIGVSNIWVGTGGEGLIEVDKATRKCRQFTEKDGLMMDEISFLNLAGDVLWIGFGLEKSGGLGQINLGSRRITTYSRSVLESAQGGIISTLSPDLSKQEQPPNSQIFAIAATQHGDVWVRARGEPMRLFHSRGKLWETLPEVGGNCLVSDAEYLFVGQYLRDYSGKGDIARELGVLVTRFNDRKWRSIQAAEGLPFSAVTAMALEGHNLWIGGIGFIACVDVPSGKVTDLAYVVTSGGSREGVEQIQIGGGYVWAKYDKHLHRAALSELH